MGKISIAFIWGLSGGQRYPLKSLKTTLSTLSNLAFLAGLRPLTLKLLFHSKWSLFSLLCSQKLKLKAKIGGFAFQLTLPRLKLQIEVKIAKKPLLLPLSSSLDTYPIELDLELFFRLTQVYQLICELKLSSELLYNSDYVDNSKIVLNHFLVK